MKILKHLAIAFIGVLAAASAQAQAVGMVLDVKGAARAELSGRSELLDITAPLKAGMRIQIEKGNELGFVFYPGHTQYSAVGPATLQVTNKSVTQLQGAAMKTKPLPENRSVAALGFQNRVVPAAMVMKTGFDIQGRPKLVEPQDGETLLTQRPEFVWEAETVAPTDFTLRLDGQVVHQQRVDAGTRLMMPEALVLQADKKYEWEVVRAQPGATGRRATFTVASAALRSQVLQGQPSAQAEVADWLLHAMVLAQANMRSESARVLRQVAGQRPASAALQTVAP